MSKERPILFSGSMVRAILHNRKTQTRRICKTRTQNQTDIMAHALADDLAGADDGRFEKEAWELFLCPYGEPGDRLWVKETWAMPDAFDEYSPSRAKNAVREDLCPNRFYRADGTVKSAGAYKGKQGKWRPSIHMPRWASRITLEIVSVRVERLQDINEADALAEGVDFHCTDPACLICHGFCAIQCYRELWEKINGPGSWDANPWVWVVEFKRIGGEA